MHLKQKHTHENPHKLTWYARLYGMLTEVFVEYKLYNKAINW